MIPLGGSLLLVFVGDGVCDDCMSMTHLACGAMTMQSSDSVLGTKT